MSGAPQMNGPSSPTGKKFIDTIDPDDAEYRKNLQRPAEVKEDIKQMSDRSRVSLILNSEAFRKELEEIVDEQLRQGNAPASLLALQQISNLLLPNHKFSQGAVGTGSTPVIPVSDIKGTEAMSYTKQEKVLRCKLASCYRLVDNNGWTHSIYNHITARISQDQEHFLINPFGMTYSEITASSLVKIDLRGEVIDPGATTLGVNQAGFTLHSAIHQFRPDIKCIIHLHTPSVVAVSGMKCGFLPLSQESLICGEVSYHDYNGILVDPEERESLQRNLGPINKVMILRNHGIVACGSSIEEAYHYAFNVVNACNAQIQAMPAGVDNLILVSQEIKQRTFATANQGGGGVDSSGKKWKIGEMEFEAQMRLMDNAGYRTGYSYKHPNIKRESRRERSNAEVEVPPASSSFTYVFDGDVEHSKYMSPIKAAMERQKQQYKVGWLNSPNVYVRQEMDEIGTQNPKKITKMGIGKWVKDEAEDGSPKRTSTPIKVDSPNQFAPQGSDPKEFKQKQKQIKKDYYEERINAGPQSKILEGMTWEEAEKMKDGSLSATGDSVIVIGAASKGIIQRDQQHNVQVYHTQYAANPFETMSEDEIEKYKWEVEHKGGPDGLPTVQEEQLEPGPEDKLVSTEERLQQVQQKVEESAPTVEISEDGCGEGYRVNAKKAMNGDDDQMRSPAKCDTLRSTDSASGGETLEERSSKETEETYNEYSKDEEIYTFPCVDAVENRAAYTYGDYTDSEEDDDTFSDETDDENSTDSEEYENDFQACRLMGLSRWDMRGYDLEAFLTEPKHSGKDEDGNTILHIAASGEDSALFELLLALNPDMIDTENKKKRTPLYIAAKNNRHEIADILIKSKAKVFVQDVKALTPLLTAIRYDSLEVFKLLEVQSKEEMMTFGWWYLKAFEIATKNNSKDVAQYLIQRFAQIPYAIYMNDHALVHSATMNNSDKLLEILLLQVPRMKISSVNTDTDSETTGDMSKKQQHKTKPFHVAAERGHLQCLKILIEKRPPDDLVTKCEHGKTVLHHAAAKGRVGVVELLIKKAPGLLYVKDKSKRTALHDAIKHVKVVEILLTSGAKINSKDKNGRTPLSHAAENGMLECTTLLVKKGADINLADNKKMGPIHFAAKEGQTEVFYKLASSKKIDLDKSAINCLDLAIDNNHVETVLRIFQIENSKWTKMLRSRSKLNDSDEFHDTPMRKLIRQMPEVARKVFNHCTKMSKASQQFEVTFDYEFLDDTYHLGTWKTHILPNKQATKEDDLKNSKDSETNQSTENTVDSKLSKDTEKSRKPYTENTNIIKENHPLMIMVTSKRIELLDHPLASALLKRKWISIGLVLNILICVLYALFLALLTGFTLDVPAPYQFQGFSECSDFTNESISAFAYYARYGIIALALIILLIEILEIKQMFSWKVWLYLLEIENVFEWITCITAIIFVVNTSGCSDSGYRPQWQWTCGTISVFLAWINMLFIIQKFEWLGIYVVMLYRIIKVFMKFLFVFSLLIIAFAISFHCLFQNQEPFSTIGKSLMRTTSMMIGGPDFVSTFLDETVHFEIVSYAFFILFMMFMAIVVINLLVGLAVNNIHEFQQKADLSKKEMQVKFALELERMATSDISKKILNLLCFKRQRNNDNKEEESNNNDSTETLKPNELSWFKKKVGESWKLTERDIKAAMSSEKDDYSMMVARLDTLETNLEVHMKYMGTQLAAILEKNENKTDET